MSIVDFAGHMIRVNPYDKGRYVTVLFAILKSNNPAVRYQCASTLLSISTSPTAIRQAALTFIDLLKTHSDSSVRLIVVDQLDAMRERFGKILQDCLLDILSVLANATMDIRKRIVALGVELVSDQNSEVFLQAIKKELCRNNSECDDDAKSLLEYKKLLIRATRTAVVRRPHMAAAVIPLVMEHLYEENSAGIEVISLIREVLHLQPSLRDDTVKQLRQMFHAIQCPTVIRTVLWLLGTHVTSVNDALDVITLLVNSMEPFPLTPAPMVEAKAQKDSDGSGKGQQKSSTQVTTIIQEDGTYVTSLVPVCDTRSEAETINGACGLRTILTKGKFFVAAPLASTLARLVTRLFGNNHVGGVGEDCLKEAQSKAIAVLSEIIRFSTADGAPGTLDDATHEQIQLALINITNPQSQMLVSVVEDSLKALESLTNQAVSNTVRSGVDIRKGDKDGVIGELCVGGVQTSHCSVDTPVMFTQIMERKGSLLELETVDELGSVVGNASIDKTGEFLSKLEKTIPLSGFGDPLYCEVSVTVHQFDVTVDWYIANSTAELLRDVTIELTPVGSMKLCERPQVHTLQPHGSARFRTALKVGSPETGVIFASILYDGPRGDRGCVVLNNIRVDIMNYVKPAICSLSEFREKWCKYDWENAVQIRTEMTDMRQYVEYILHGTNMGMMKPYPEEDEEVLLALKDEGDNGHRYVSCNMYARTLFGEDALMNVSIEKDADGKLSGTARVRANTRPIAFGFGEKLASLNRRVAV